MKQRICQYRPSFVVVGILEDEVEQVIHGLDSGASGCLGARRARRPPHLLDDPALVVIEPLAPTLLSSPHGGTDRLGEDR